MSKKAITWLYSELPGLIAKGILTQEAADKLQGYYGEVESAGKKWIGLIVCGVLGAILIGLGIILLFAHNWEQFSRFTRAILSFTPLAIAQGLALWVLLKRPESSALKEGAATFLALMVGASIALISQTYNIPGDAGTFTLTWMLLIVPLVYLMQASLPAAIYLIGITAWSGSHWNNLAMAILFWPLTAIVVPHFIWALRREDYTIRSTIISLIMTICVLCGIVFSLGKSWPGFWIVIYSSVYAILYSLGHWKFRDLSVNWQRPLQIIGTLGVLVLAFQFTISYIWKYTDYCRLTQEASGLVTLASQSISFIIIGIALLLFYDNLRHKNLTASLFTMLPILALVSYFLKGEGAILPLLIFNAYLLMLGISRIAIGLRNNSLAAINMGMLILAILIMMRFFDSDISFVIKGLAFIGVGSGFLITNIVLMRRKGGAQ